MMRIAALLVSILALSPSPRTALTTLRGSVVDAASGKALPCRVSIRDAMGEYHSVKSDAPDGSAIEYRKQAGQNRASFEHHVTLSAHPFKVDLAPGKYTVVVQRGKEYFAEAREIEIKDAPVDAIFKLKRWIDMAAQGWYSGETHVHRMADQLPNLQLAEDLNVALPLSSWVTEANTSPKSANKAGEAVMNDARVIEIDPTHVFYPRNTEYEIFRVGQKSHTLGALFILNHKTLFESGLPPVRPIVKKARDEGALLELDKHNWPWSMMLAPVFNVDLYELTNNHLWETAFAFRDFGEAAPEYMGIEKDANGMTERGWIDYTFQNYYALLNCGLRMRPTAGCASGVHPVPLGFGRVYVHLDGPFSYDAWIKGLNEGRSFVTTGPMLFVTNSGPGSIVFSTKSAYPLERIDIVINGEIRPGPPPTNNQNPDGSYSNNTYTPAPAEGSAWVAVRCFETRPDGRVRFAHSAPIYRDVPGKPLRPRKVEVEFLIRRIEKEIARNQGVLKADAMAEYQEALEFYQVKLKEAR